MQGKALTPEEKKERVLARSQADRQGDQTERKRNVFNGTQGKLHVNADIPGYTCHIFNDIDNRIELALEGGWEFVSPKEVSGIRNNVVDANNAVDDRVRFLVNPRHPHHKYGYLMKIKTEWYEEDQRSIQQRNDLVDNAIRNGRNVKEGTSSDGFYVPKGGITMSQSNKF